MSDSTPRYSKVCDLHREAPVRRVREMRLVDQVSSGHPWHHKGILQDMARRAGPYLPLPAHAGRSWPGLRATSWVMCKAHATRRYPDNDRNLAQEASCGPAAARRAGAVSTVPRTGSPGASRLARTCSASMCAVPCRPGGTVAEDNSAWQQCCSWWMERQAGRVSDVHSTC